MSQLVTHVSIPAQVTVDTTTGAVSIVLSHVMGGIVTVYRDGTEVPGRGKEKKQAIREVLEAAFVLDEDGSACGMMGWPLAWKVGLDAFSFDAPYGQADEDDDEV